MKDLVLITNAFPYGKQETFLENEIPWLCKYFNVTIVTLERKLPDIREIDKRIKVVKSDAPICHHSIFKKVWYGIGFLMRPQGRKELVEIIHNRGSFFRQLKDSMQFYANAQEFYKCISRQIDVVSRELIIYSYWSYFELLGFLLHKKKNQKIITRMHGGDLYNERMVRGRQVFKRQMDSLLDACIFVSEFGMNYYLNNFANDINNKYLFRLGTLDCGSSLAANNSNRATICSCSNIIKLKRVKLIVQALRGIDDIELRWIHFGDDAGFGEEGEMEEVISLSRELPANIEVVFMGRVGNQQVLDFYKNNYVSCFITTTSTEGGCPVSIMEALSFGIPIVATSVGGITEMIKDTNNILLNSIPSAEEIKDGLCSMLTMSDVENLELRNANRELWRNMFNADYNNLKWTDYLREL